MLLVSIQNLTKHYADKVIFNQVSFSLNAADRVGVVGVNGSGKTTLLKLLAGVELPDSGEIVRNAKIQVEYLPQNPPMDAQTTILDYLFGGNSPTMQLLRRYQSAVLALANDTTHSATQQALDEISHQMDIQNGWAAEAEAKSILTRLGVSVFDTPLGQLSGGQRRRVALARALLDPVDLLILDEPTNHIDPDTIIWLENHLANLKSALLMVTHDRYFLDRVTDRILEIDGGSIINHRGNYTVYLENKAQREAVAQKTEIDRRNILKRELDWIRRTPMARGGKQKARIERAEAMLEAAPIAAAGALVINPAARRTGKQIIELKQVSKAFDGPPLIRNFSYTVNRGDRLGIIGPNGSDKTTLLNLIAGRIKPDAGQITIGETIHLGYYDQESEALNEDQRVIDNITDVAQTVQTAAGDSISAAQLLERFQFSRKVQWSYISTLSGGERRRLYLLRTLMTSPNVLLLDEPTNDLDIQTLSILEDYLDDYAGVLIVVSHDRYFLDRTAEHIFAFEGNGHIKQYPGNYTAYLSRQQPTATVKTPLPPAKAAKQPAETKKPAKLSYKETHELAALETQIAALEAEKDDLIQKINQIGEDYRQLQAFSERLTELETTLEAALNRWAELAEIAEG